MDNPVNLSSADYCQRSHHSPLLKTPFCSTCLRNQEFVMDILSCSPYSNDIVLYNEKKAALERRHPPVCSAACRQLVAHHLEIKEKILGVNHIQYIPDHTIDEDKSSSLISSMLYFARKVLEYLVLGLGLLGILIFLGISLPESILLKEIQDARQRLISFLLENSVFYLCLNLFSVCLLVYVSHRADDSCVNELLINSNPRSLITSADMIVSSIITLDVDSPCAIPWGSTRCISHDSTESESRFPCFGIPESNR